MSELEPTTDRIIELELELATMQGRYDACAENLAAARHEAAEAEEQAARLQTDLFGARGCLSMIADALENWGCACESPQKRDHTPPIMYPEWIACVIKKHVLEERSRCAVELSDLRASLAALSAEYANRGTATLNVNSVCDALDKLASGYIGGVGVDGEEEAQ